MRESNKISVKYEILSYINVLSSLIYRISPSCKCVTSNLQVSDYPQILVPHHFRVTVTCVVTWCREGNEVRWG